VRFDAAQRMHGQLSETGGLKIAVVAVKTIDAGRVHLQVYDQ
jgi:hypothetical protein